MAIYWGKQMYCTKCGLTLEKTWAHCPSCGTANAEAKTSTDAKRKSPAASPEPEDVTSSDDEAVSPNAVAEPATRSTKRGGRNWAITIGVIVAAWLLFQFVIMPALSGRLPDGGVNLDVALVEQEIENGILDQIGVTVTVDCPDTMQGKPGETRNCIVTASDGSILKAVVTIESSNGDITWETQ
jgi:hypothetical protein